MEKYRYRLFRDPPLIATFVLDKVKVDLEMLNEAKPSLFKSASNTCWRCTGARKSRNKSDGMLNGEWCNVRHAAQGSVISVKCQ